MKSYWVTFGGGGVDPRIYTGLSTSFVQFGNSVGATSAPPGITEMYPGWYRFQYDVGVTNNIAFTIDGGATLSASIRYITGVLDPNDLLSFNVGSTASSFGTTQFPTDLFGFAKRISEFNEGVQTFIKNSGEWAIFDRGASTLLRMKTLTNNVTGVTAIP